MPFTEQEEESGGMAEGKNLPKITGLFRGKQCLVIISIL